MDGKSDNNRYDSKIYMNGANYGIVHMRPSHKDFSWLTHFAYKPLPEPMITKFPDVYVYHQTLNIYN